MEKKKYCGVFLVVLALSIIPLSLIDFNPITEIENKIEIIENEENLNKIEDENMTKRPFFQKITGANSDLILLKSFYNLDAYNGTHWFIKDISDDPYVASVVGLTGATVTAGVNRTYDPGAGYIFKSAITRTFDDDIYIITAYYRAAAQTLRVIGFHSLDGGVNWQAINVKDFALTLHGHVLDLIKIGSQVYYVISRSKALTTTVFFYKFDNSAHQNFLFNTGLYEQHIISGYLDDIGTTYYFLIDNPNQDATYISIYNFTEAGGVVYVKSSGITSASITTWDVYTQIYFLKEFTEIFMNQDTLKSRWNETSWAFYSVSTGTSVNGVIWDKNNLNKSIISFILWGNAIWNITDKGILEKIQSLEPRDYKKVYLSNKNENLLGVIQFQTHNGNDNLDEYTEVGGSLDTNDVVDEIGGHKNIVHNVQDIAVVWNRDIGAAVSSGSVECYIRLGQTNKALTLAISDSTNQFICRVIFEADGKIDFEGTANDADIQNYSAFVWYHLKVDFIRNGNCELFLDGTSISTRTGNNTADSDYLFRMSVGANDLEYWFDAHGYSGDSYVANSIKKINAYVGYGSDIDEAWFSTGDSDTSIMQLSFHDYTEGTLKALVIPELYKAPKCSLVRQTRPFEDEFIKLYTDAEQLYYQGKVEDNDNDNRFLFIYNMRSYEDEYAKTKINGTLIQYTWKEAMEWVIDNFSKWLWHGRGTNGDVDDFVSGLTGWTNNDGASCVSSYLSEKILGGVKLTDVLQQYDNNAAGFCEIYKTITQSSIISFYFGISDVTKNGYVKIYEGATRIGILRIGASNLYWYDGAWQSIQVAVSSIYYHITLAFSAVDDDVDIYIDGVFNSTQNLGNNISSGINKLLINTGTGDIGFYYYVANIYYGNILVNAMHTFSSISPLLTTKRNFNFKNDLMPMVQKQLAEETAYVVSVRPSGQVYVDQYTPFEISISITPASTDVTYQSLMKPRNMKFSLITFYGGFINGKQIFSEGFGEPSFGNYEDWFPEIRGQDPDDIYYDSNGNPKSHRLDAMVTTAIANRNVLIKKQTIGIRGVGLIHPGTSFKYTNPHYKIDDETWLVWRRNTYDGRRDDNHFMEIADSFISPTSSDTEDSTLDQINQAIGVNSENITKTGQNVGSLEENVNSEDGQGIYPAGVDTSADENYGWHENVHNFDENLTGWTGFTHANSVKTYHTNLHNTDHVLELMAGDASEELIFAYTGVANSANYFSARFRAEAIDKDKQFLLTTSGGTVLAGIQMDSGGTWQVWRNGAWVNLPLIPLAIDICYHVYGYFDDISCYYWIDGEYVYGNTTTDTGTPAYIKLLSTENNDGNSWFISSYYAGIIKKECLASLCHGGVLTCAVTIGGHHVHQTSHHRNIDSSTADFTSIVMGNRDCSYLVPPGTTAVKINMRFRMTSANKELYFKKGGFTNWQFTGFARHIGHANEIYRWGGWVDLDSNYIFQVSVSAGVVNLCDIYISKWEVATH